ncbi:hypothetical protein M427DRAFT_34598 [Gonapodya prolifera JEL478]|uniref:Phytase-like domain-containing protein n=1 Tax=Gonapodya prolifera (strain JEL478) TaxID=1344416 RepID=A0A139A705_GONPJ|nr:hypothetical protein M427DRAFT_34598 [Gonapodya prolifera JEL478]|eukprot:KXS12580.1 hypothetical protein M427DRAFT_34598 [Gonapodya prolifera JEL478]
MRFLLLLAATFLVVTGINAQQKFPAVLKGHALLADSFRVDVPADAPEFFQTAGKYTGSGKKRMDKIGGLPAVFDTNADPSTPRPVNVSLPIKGQSVQGMSGVRYLGNGMFALITDNGYGSKFNSPDAILMVHVIQYDWATGGANYIRTIFLSDPNKKLPFQIVAETTKTRYLSGADLDIESINFIGDTMWIGEEFGPYLLEFDWDGKLLNFYENAVPGIGSAKAPENYNIFPLPTNGQPGAVTFEVRRSRGFESSASTIDGKFIYALFEGPLWNATNSTYEQKDGVFFNRMIKFNVTSRNWTGEQWFYPLENAANVLGDMAMIDDTSAIVIERDDTTEGDPDFGCKAGQNNTGTYCFARPAAFKRVYKIVIGEPGTYVKKVGYIDLIDIDDPNGVAKIGKKSNGKFVMPHQNPEGVCIVDKTTIAVVNDNNYPGNAGRTLAGKPDDNEIAWLSVPEFLAAV